MLVALATKKYKANIIARLLKMCTIIYAGNNVRYMLMKCVYT